MSTTTRFPMGARLAAMTLLAGLGLSSPAHAWMHDQDSNRIDDRIERVHRAGYAAAFVGEGEGRRLAFGVTNGTTLSYAIYVCYDRIPSASDVALVSATGVPWVRPYLYFPFVRTEGTFAQIEAMAALPRVTRIEVVPMMYLANHVGSRAVRARDSRGYVKSQDDVLFPSAHQQLGLDGTGIVVAIFDTGVNDDVDVATSYPGHESLRGKFLGGGEFFYGNPLLNTANTASINPQDHGAEASQYHATHVAGTAIGTGGPGGTFAGVAPAARLVDIKVLSDAGASLSGVPEGIEWCLFNKNKLWPGLTGADSIYRGIDVINMSLGDVLSSDGTEADAIAVNVGVRGGLAIVCASGNLGMQSYIASPSSADSSICVGATTHAKSIERSDDRVTSFSQEGARADDGDLDHVDEMKPNVVAPGNGIVSADGDPAGDGTNYKSLSGTSMASPHVAGCVALVLQANPALTPLQVRSILQNTAEHQILSEKGDRPNDPFGLDPNYDPGCGWGLVDVYAAAKEALNPASGVQVTQMVKPVARVQDGAVDLGWITQREYPFQGFEVHRAPDVNGAPGPFARINPVFVPPSGAGDPLIQADDNRTTYAYVDADPLLVPGRTYWYRVAWVEGGAAHPEPALRAEYGAQPRLATAYYSITHDAPDSDLGLRLGMSRIFDPSQPNFAMFGPGSAQQDSFQFSPIDFVYVPPGHIRHFWSLGLTAADGVASFLPPSRYNPWFLDVEEGGFADQSGRIESFSMFVNDSPGSSSGTTYVTDSPTPRPTVEMTRVTLWIPERPTTSVEIANLTAVSEHNGVRVTLALARPAAGTTAQVYRSATDDFAVRQPLTGRLAVDDMSFEYLDTTAEPGVSYSYWIVLEDPDGGAFVNGPVSGSVPVAAVTFLGPASPNPAVHGCVVRYGIGADAAGGGPTAVSVVLYDSQGRMVRELARRHESPGDHHVAWDGTDTRGARAPTGLYFVRLQAGPVTRVGRISVIH